MGKDFNTGLRKSLEADRVKLTRRRKQLLRDMGLSEDLDSTELAEKLHEQSLVNDVLNRSLARKDEEIERLRAEIAELKGGRQSIPKTSANSSIPPSKNPIGVPHTQSLRKPSGRKTGGQKGHEGSTRLQSEDVTGTERWYPAAVCPQCGKPLDMDTATVSATRQVVDVPLPIAAEVINHLQMQVKCSCGHCCRGQFPENVSAPVSYGPNIMAMTSYLSTYQNAVATYLAFDKSRSHNVVNKHFTKEEQGGMVWVTDRLPAYFMGDVGMEDHQICIAHLLRNLTYTMQAFPDDAWSLDMLDLLRDSVHHRNQGDIGTDVRTKMEERLDELLARPPIYTSDDGKETELDKLKKGIAKHRDHVFTFLTNPAVPPTNNDSEKALRPAKTKLKVSGCFRTEAGVENYATVASVIQTAVKNGQNPFEVLRVIATLALA